MKASLTQREPARLIAWKTEEVYAKLRHARQDRPLFMLHDGPPYANGHLHCGHALNKILKDMIVKSKSLSGFNAPFIPGWDCHGLPIELNVEKKVGKVGAKVDASAFRQLCRDYAASQIDIQRDEFERLGVFGDWYNPYTTMQYQYEANVVRALAKIVKNGHLQQGFKPVHWCLDCASSLAEAEVDYEDKVSASIDVAFMAVDNEAFLACLTNNLPAKRVIVPIWTTTPWTLPANEAVALHAELDYALVDTVDAYFLIASDLVSSVVARYGIEQWTTCALAKGEVFENLLLQHPLYSHPVPLVLSTHVTTDSGTGCVHTAPAHGPDDYLVGLNYKLPLKNPVLGNGCYAEDVPLFAGLFVRKADPLIINTLREKQVLLHETTIHHSYPHCWRHKTPVIFRATPQWFIAMDKNGLRDALLKQVEEVTWVPAWGKARILNMIKDRPDWCISRQRSWGTPMSLFVHRTTHALHPNTVELMEKVAKRIEEQGIDAWFNLDASELLGDDALHYEKINDTLDVWFDSGVSHFCVLGSGDDNATPADLYFEGSDQHRGWFNSSLTTAVAMNKRPPYKEVLTHGYTVDAHGKKLSKSKGNYVALDQLVHQHGADILRLWVSSTDYRNEVSISDEIIKRAGDAYRRIRNTARFLLANLFDFDPSKHMLDASKMVELDRWAIKRCQALQEEILQAYEDYHFHVIYQKIHNFCAVDLGGFYLDIIKDRQYTTPTDSHARRSCQVAMYHILHALTRWLAPILSFTAEEIWEAIPGFSGQSLFLEEWYQAWPVMPDVDMHVWDKIYLIRDEVNKALESQRQAGHIGSALEARVTLFASDDVHAMLSRLGHELRFILITSSAQVLPLNVCPSDAVVDETLGVAILIEALTHTKCVRCWHRCEDIGQNASHPELCLRCVGNVTGHAETRCFA
jgi:isoleucyl-tRNA synthetase